MAKIDEVADDVGKLREEVLELRAEVAKGDGLRAEVAELRAGLERLTAAPQVKPAGAKATPAPYVLPEKYKGTKSYRVGPSKHYRAGRVYREGEIVTVTDEAPDADWTPVEDVEAATAPASDAPPPNGKTDRTI